VLGVGVCNDGPCRFLNRQYSRILAQNIGDTDNRPIRDILSPYFLLRGDAAGYRRLFVRL